MNKIHRVIWNEITRTFVAVAEITKARGKRASTGVGGGCASAFGLRPLAVALFSIGLAHAAPPVPTQLPTGGLVVAGQAAISQNNAVMNVNQASNRAAIDWQTFNIGSQAQVNFNQPSASSAILNRVLDANPSQIFGNISSNGQVFLTNPSGVYFSPGSSANVGALTATTHSIGNADFMAGNLRFSRDGATGAVVNEGTLNADLNGYIALLAPEVRNHGVVFAQLGTVALAAGEVFELQFDGNRLSNIRVEASTIQALVDNGNAVEAPGGLIILSAQAANSLQGGVIRNTGRVEAAGLVNKGGVIRLEASDSIDNSGLIRAGAMPAAQSGEIDIAAGEFTQSAAGELDVSGDEQGGSLQLTVDTDLKLSGRVDASAASGSGGSIKISVAGETTIEAAVVDASGASQGGRIEVAGGAQPSLPNTPENPEQSPKTVAILGNSQLRASSQSGEGGEISLTGEQVGLFDATAIDVSGATGGGTVLVGGDYQGSNPDVANAKATYIAEDVVIRADATQAGDGGKVIVWADEFTNYQGHISAQGGSEGGDGGFAEVSGKRTLAFDGTVDLTAAQGETGTLLLDPRNITIQSGGGTLTTPFTATVDDSVVDTAALTTALSSANVTVSTGSDGTQDGNINVASDIGWFSNKKLTLNAAGAITINADASIQNFTGSLEMTAGTGITQTVVVDGGGAQTSLGTLMIGGTTQLSTTSGNISLNSTTNLLTGAVTATAGSGNVSIKNARTLALGNVSASGSVTLETTANAGSITSSGTFAAASLNAKAHDTGGISIADVTDDLIVNLLEAGGAITLGNADTGTLTFTHTTNGQNVIVGNDAAGGQASGIVTLTGASIALNDPIRTKGGNVVLVTMDSDVTTASDANITTTADGDTGTSSGSVSVTAAQSITLQNITTTGADNSIGVGSNAASVTLSATAGTLTVGAITTSGGAANPGATTNRNGGNAGNIIIGAGSAQVIAGTTGARSGLITLKGDLTAVGGNYVGAASYGLGGYIEVQSPLVLTDGNRSVSSGSTTGNITFLNNIDSDGTARSLTVTAGTGDVLFEGVIGSSAALSSLSVSSSVRTDIEKNVTTSGASGVSVSASSQIRLGDNDVTNGSGGLTINTLAGNGTVTMSSNYTYLDDSATFTRGSGEISFAGYLYSNTSERNDLTFNGAGGGDVTVNWGIGGGGATPTTKLGDILFETVDDITVGETITAGSLVSLNGTGRINLGQNSNYSHYYDYASGLQLATTGTHNHHSGDESFYFYGNVTNSHATAPISVSTPNGAISFYTYADLTTAGGDIELSAGTVATSGTRSVTLGSETNLNSNGGLVSLTGVGVSQSPSSTGAGINAGSGKIRIDGGGAAVSFLGQMVTTDSDSGDSAAVLITNVSGGNSAAVRSVTAQTGTLQAGLIAGDDTLATAQTLGGAGDLSLITETLRFTAAKQVTLTSVGDDSGRTFTITGTADNGDVLVENINGGSATTVTSTGSFKTITSIAANGATADTVSVGLVSNDAIGNQFSQTNYGGGYAGTDKIDIKTLSAATGGAISITSAANVIDELGDFAVGSSLDVRAKGRAAGMALTGDVAATSVTIMTGNGALVLGDRDITSTSGNVLLVGTGITQSAGSTITSAGTTELYGNDYQDGTRGIMTLSGDIVSASNVSILSTLNLQLPNITIGSAGSRGTLTLGADSNNSYPWATYNGIYGTISQTGNTAIEVGTLQGLQVAGYGTTTLTNPENEIRYLGTFYRGGAYSVFDADTESNGLTINGNIWDGTINNPLKIETLGDLTHTSSIRGQGVYLSGDSITSSGEIRSYEGSGTDRDLVLQANGGNVTLSGTYRIDGAGNDLIVRKAGNVQLGYTTDLDSKIQLGSPAVAEALAASQVVGDGGGNLTLDGSSTSGGSATFAVAERVAITSVGDDSGVTFTVTGTDMFGRAQTDVITGGNATTATGSKYFATITQIAASAQTAGNLTVGTALENVTGNVTQTSYLWTDSATLTGVVDGTVNLPSTDNLFAYIGDLVSGGDFTARSRPGTLTVNGDVVSNGGNIYIENYYYGLTVADTGTVSADADTKGVTLRATAAANTGSTAIVQGAVSAGSGGINLSSTYGGVSTSGAGTLTTDGGVTINSRNAYATSIGAAVSAGGNGIDINSGGNFSNTVDGTLTATGGITIDSDSGYTTTIGGAISAGVGGNNNIAIVSGNTFSNSGSGTLDATGSVSIRTTWDGLNERDLSLGANVTAGNDGINLTSSGTINQTGGILNTTGTLSGNNQSGGTPSASLPSARGAVTLTRDNEIVNLGQFYLYDEGPVAFNVRDVTGGLTLTGNIENSHGAITVTTLGGLLNLSGFDVYAGGMASGGANIALTGQGINQGFGSDINTTGGATGTPRTGANGGGTITLTGHDGSASGTISLGGSLQTMNATASAVTIRGTSDLTLPSIDAPDGGLRLGDDTATIGQITGNITQTVNTSLDIDSLRVGTATNAIGGSAVLANSGNTIVELAEANVGDVGGTQYDLDIYDSTDGLVLTQNLVSDGGIRVRTTTGGGSSGVLSLGALDVLAAGDIFLGGDSVTQAVDSIVDADNSGVADTGGSIRIDGGGGANNITLEGTLTTDNAGSTAVQIVNATNLTFQSISATTGTVALGIPADTDLPTPSLAKALTGTIQGVDENSVISAATLAGNAGVVTLNKTNLDNLGTFTTTGTMTLKDQGGAGTAGLKLTGNVTVGGTTEIQTTDGVLDFDVHTLDASGNTGYGITLRGVGISQEAASSIKSTTAEIYGGAADIDLFSALNNFTGQVSVYSSGDQVSVQDANQLSMNALTGNLDPTTSVKLWAGTGLVLTPEDISTTSGNIEFRSLDGNLSTPGNLTTTSGNIALHASTTTTTGNVQVNNLITTGSGNVTVEAEKEVNLSKSIVSTSGDIAVSGATVTHSTGSSGDPLTLETGADGTITVVAGGAGGFVMGQYYGYQSDTGTISITSGGSADLANISTNGTLTVDAVGLVQQVGSGSVLAADALRVTTANNGAITLTNAGNDLNKVKLQSRNPANNDIGSGVIAFHDVDGFAVSEISTSGNATLTALGSVTTDSAVFGDGSVTANALSVKTLNDAGADILLTAANNDVTTLTLKVRNAADDAIAGATPTGTIRFTDADGVAVTSIETGGSTILTAGAAVTQTGAIVSDKLGLSGDGSFTLNSANLGTPINQVSTFASDAAGAINFSSQLALTIGAVNPVGITSHGANVTILAPSINASGATIDTRSSLDSTAGGALTLTTTGAGAAGNLTSGDINTSGTAAAILNGGGGAAGNVTLTASGESLVVAGAITARGGIGDGIGADGADGRVKLTATAGAVTQTDGAHAIDAGLLLVNALNTSSLLDTGNTTDRVSALISGVGENFVYRSGGNFAIGGGGEDGINGITTQGGYVDLDGSDVAVSVTQAVITKGGDFSALGVRSFDSSGVTINTAGDVTYAGGVYKDGGDIDITTTANGGAIDTGTLIASADVNNAGDATSGNITLNADGALTVRGTTAQGKGTGIGGNVDLTGAGINIAGSVDTSSNGAAGGNINVNGPAVIVGADRVLATGSGAGNISFSSTVDSDAPGTPRGLSLTAGTGDISFTGAIGNTAALGAVNIVSAKDVAFNSSIDAASLTQQAGTGTTTLAGATALSGNLSFTGNALNVNAGVTTGGSAIVSNAGLFTTAAAGDIAAAGGFTQNGAGLNELAGDITTTDSNIAFATAVTLTGDVAMSTDTGAGNITFADTVDSDLTARDLSLTSGLGNVTFTGVVGGTHALDALSVNSAGVTTFSAAVAAASVVTDAQGSVAINGGSVSTSGSQTYNDALTLGNNTTLTGSSVTTNGTQDGLTHSLLVDGDAVFGDAADDSVTGLTTLEVTGATTINTDTVTSADAQTYTGAVTLGNSTTLTAGNDPILFSSTVDSEANEDNALTVNAGSGAVTFTGVVGGGVNGELGALAVNSTGATKFEAAVTAASVVTNVGGTVEINGGAVTTTGVQTYGENATLGADTNLQGTTVTFSGTLNSAEDAARTLTVTGAAVFTGAVGEDATGSTTLGKLGSLHVTGSSAIDGGLVTTTGAQAYDGAVTLGADTTLTGTTVTTQGTLAGATHSLEVTGNAVFGNGAADTVTGLTTLAVRGTTTINTDTVTSSSTQGYAGAVTVAENSNLTASTVTFDTTVDSAADAAKSLTVTGDAVFMGAVGEETTGSTTLGKLGSVHVTGTSAIDGGMVTSTGAQTYAGAVTLGADTTLQGSVMSFGASVDGTGDATESLTLAGAASFGGDVGATHALAALSVSGATMLTADIGVTATNVAFGGMVDGTTAGEEALAITGDVSFSDDVGATEALQGLAITGATTLTADIGVTSATVAFDGTLDGTAAGEQALTIVGNVGFGADVGAAEALQALSVTGATTLTTDVAMAAIDVAFNGTLDGTTAGAEALSITGAATFSGDVGANNALEALSVSGATTLTADVAMTATNATFSGTIDGTDAGTEALTVTGATSLGANVGANTALQALTLNGATTLTADVGVTATSVAFNGTLEGTTAGSEALAITGDATFGGAVGSAQALESLSVSGSTVLDGGSVSTTGDQTYTGAVTLGADADLTSSTGAINLGSTIDSDADLTPRSLRLTSASLAGQNFVAAVGGTHALDLLRIESAGVVTQGGSAPIKAAKLAIKSAGTATLNHAGNDIDVLAALLSGDANLVFVDADGVQIGSIDSAALQIVGISDGDGTSNVSITVGGALTQAASSPILLDGNLTLDSTAYNADDVAIKNTAVAGTLLDNSLIAGDFTLNSTGAVTQKADVNNGETEDAFLQVGGSFDLTGSGQFVQGNSPDNLIGGGSAAAADNEIRLYGVITLSMNGSGDLLATADNGTGTTNASILAADIAAGITVISDAGGKSISAVNDGAAITLNEANSIGGALKITTQGTYSVSGPSVATGILQNTALELAGAAFLVQQSATNAGSVITGAGKLDLSDAGNTFTGTVSGTALGMDAHLRADSSLQLGSVNAGNVIIELDGPASSNTLTQTGSIIASTLLLRNAGATTLNGANRVGTLAAVLNGDLAFTNNQALAVGTASAVSGITTTNSDVLLRTTTGNLTLNGAITVPGAADITLVSAANFINNVGANALVIGTGAPEDTGVWQVWSTAPALDTLGGLTPEFKQYNATYGVTASLGSGNGLHYTLAPELTVTLIDSVERVYDATEVATLAQSNYDITGLLVGDAAVLSTAGTYDDKNVDTGKTVTTDGLSIVSASAGGGSIAVYGYQLDADSADEVSGAVGTITAKTVALSASKIYDGSTSLTGFVSVDTGISGEALTYADATASDKNVAIADKFIDVITLADGVGGLASNYQLPTLDKDTAAVTITAKVVALSASKVYDGTTDLTGAVTIDTGVVVGVDSETLTYTGATASDAHVATANKYISALTLADADDASGGLASNYVLPSLAVAETGVNTLNITVATLTSTVSNLNVSKVYDGNTDAPAGFTPTYSYTGLVAGDTDAALNHTAATYDDKDVLDASKITVSGLSLDSITGGNGSQASDYVLDATSKDVVAGITAKALTATVAAPSKVYDGNTTAAPTLTITAGLVNTETVAATGTATFNDKDVLDANLVTVTGTSLADGANGGIASNYSLAAGQTVAANITPKALTATVAAPDKVYDGTTTADPTLTITAGLVDTETVVATGTATFNDKDVLDANLVTVTGTSLADGANGGIASNYSLATGQTVAASITEKALTVVAEVGDRTYDGTANAVLNGLSLDGFVGAETLQVLQVFGGTTLFDDKTAAAEKNVTITGIVTADGDNGGLASNYSVDSTVFSSASIFKKDLTVAGVVALDKVYDGNTVAAINTSVASLSGKIGGDDVSIGSITGTFDDKSVGNNKNVNGSEFVMTGDDGGNYNLIQPTGLSASITPRSLSVAATGVNKIYDATTAATVVLSDNRIEGDLIEFDYTANFLDKNVGNNKFVGVSGIALAGDDAGNYTSNTTTAAFANIDKATLTVSATGVNRAYDGTTNAAVTLSDDRLGDDTLALSYGAASFSDPNTSFNKQVTVTGINVTGADAGNYTFNVTATTFADILGRLLSISGVTANSRVYDGTMTVTLDLSSASLSGLLEGDSVMLDTGNGLFADKNVGTNKPVTVSQILLMGEDANVYVLELPVGLLADITPATLSAITGITADNKVYDGNTSVVVHTGGANYVGMVADDVLNVASFDAAFVDKNAGIGKQVVINDIVLGGDDAGNYVFAGGSQTTADIAQKVLSVSGISAADKVYDGGVGATLSTTGAVFDGLVAEDDFSLTATGAFDTKNVGSDKTVTLNSSYSGDDVGNYAITSQTETTADITAKAVTISGIAAADKVYDGGTTATVDSSGALASFLDGDAISVNSSGAFDSKNVGNNKTVTLSNIYSGDDVGNYTITDQTETTADVTAKTLTVSGISAADKVYDGNTVATVSTSGAVLNGLVVGDALNVAATGSFDSKHVGSDKTVALNSSYSGDDVGNYAITSQAETTADVTAKALTVSGISAADKVYDGNTVATVSTSGAVLSGLVVGDALNVAASGTFDSKNVGSDKTVTLNSSYSGDDVGNYSITSQAETTADVTAKALTLSGVTAADKIYDGNLSANVDTSAAVIIGVVSGETVAIDLSAATGSFGDKNVGIDKGVSIEGLALSGVDSGNYSISDQASATADITAKALTVSGISAADKVYDGNTAATVNTSGAVLNGLVVGDVLSVAASGTFDSKNVGSDKTVALNSSYSGDDVGNYAITSQAETTADVTAKAVTISGIAAADKVYDGGTTATVDSSGALASFLDGDAINISSSGEFDSKNVGNNKTVTLSNSYSGDDVGNYAITDQTETTADVTAKALTVSGISAADKVYDGNTVATVSTSGAVLNGLVVGDALNVAATGSFDSKNVGSDKTVTLNSSYSGDDVGNYSITSQAETTADITRLASVAWVGAPTGNWFDPENWAGGAVPDLSNVANVVIPTNVEVSFSEPSEPVNIDSLGSSGGLTLISGDLNVGTGGIQMSSLTQSGGSLISAGPVVLDSLVQTGGSTQTDQDMTVSQQFSQSNSGSVAVGGNLIIVDAVGGSVLGNIDVDGNLDVASQGGGISQVGDTTINVAGSTSLSTDGDITLGGENDFAGPVNAQGGNIALNDVNDLEFGDVTATGTFTVDATLGVTQTPESSINVTGSAKVTSAQSTVILANSSNHFLGGLTITDVTTADSLVPLPPTVPVQLPELDVGGEPLAPLSGSADAGATGLAGVGLAGVSVVQGEPGNAGVTVSLVSEPTPEANGVITVAVPKTLIETGAGFSFGVPAQIAEQISANTSIQVSTVVGEALPSWLTFVRESLSFVAANVPVGGLPIQVVINVNGVAWGVVISEQDE